MLAVTPGNKSDYAPAQDCIGAVPPAKHLIADKGYDSNALRDWLKRRGTQPVIPPRSNRKVQLRYDKKLYRERNRIERSLGRLKDFRRVATRFDRNVTNFMAALCLAAVVIWWCQRVRTLDALSPVRRTPLSRSCDIVCALSCVPRHSTTIARLELAHPTKGHAPKLHRISCIDGALHFQL